MSQAPVQPLHQILDSKENVAKARVQQLSNQQKLQYISPSDRKENMSPTSKKLMDHKAPVKKLSGLRLEHQDENE
ncbi:hypothetical protein BN1211_2358 [Cyberlindnera jadinii]|uniref:Uncharacterized protein n=1 Tax=Cyberlindnera jadinii (strain ATCC 18201 / CBS 1600 / BCRC 20928 / JCM 3617 / NBRC 0987 / NRRL Y-1542) TaxID=983966 RepID=A0A0H5CBW5_CYBJN|nr:hypothetical protein BN1211_2358 [Cyberlindnera jadinii]